MTLITVYKNFNEILTISYFSGDDKGGITVFKEGKFQFMMNLVENVKGLFVEKVYIYTLASIDLRYDKNNKNHTIVIH